MSLALVGQLPLADSPVPEVSSPAPGPAAVKDASLQLDHIFKTFHVNGQPLPVLDDISLVVGSGEFVCLVGASGCGKSTILRLIAGLETATAGEVRLNGRKVSEPGLERGIVFQEHRLFPWLTVTQNILLGLDALPIPEEQKRQAVAEHIELVGLTGFEAAYPRQLSGGMAQRAAIARSLVARPAVLLLDEPLGALDALTRTYLQEELLRIWRQEAITTLMVTHDVEEALYLADRVVVLDRRPGRIRKIVEVGIARPRRRGDAAFAALKEAVLGELRQ
jgi:ABC-type nitrate/sulfonate/bicarbonate transport system ATPase subunit